MALLLRLAAALDRRPAPLIEALRVHRDGPSARPTGLAIELVPACAGAGEPDVDLSLERWSLAACAEVVLEQTGLSLRVPEIPSTPPR